MSKIIELAAEYKQSPFRLWLGPYFAVAVGHPEDLQVITFFNTLFYNVI